MRYSPLALVVVLCVTLVATFTASTLAFGTPAPLGSRIVPVKSPLIAWARSEIGAQSSARSAIASKVMLGLVRRAMPAAMHLRRQTTYRRAMKHLRKVGLCVFCDFP